jgi:DNA-binding Lrp family transcriptional regulator
VTTVSNRLRELKDGGVIEEYSPQLNYDGLGHDVTAIPQLKLEGDVITDVVNRFQEQPRMMIVHEETGDHDIIAVGQFRDTDEMNAQIRSVLTDTAVRESNTSVVLNTVVEGRQFKLDADTVEDTDE